MHTKLIKKNKGWRSLDSVCLELHKLLTASHRKQICLRKWMVCGNPFPAPKNIVWLYILLPTASAPITLQMRTSYGWSTPVAHTADTRETYLSLHCTCPPSSWCRCWLQKPLWYAHVYIQTYIFLHSYIVYSPTPQNSMHDFCCCTDTNTLNVHTFNTCSRLVLAGAGKFQRTAGVTHIFQLHILAKVDNVLG